MARRNANLAGLAALGALAYMARGDKNTPEQAAAMPVEDRRGTPVTGQGLAAMGLAARPDLMAGEEVDRNENYGFEGRREGPIASLEGRRPAAPARARVPAADIEAGRADYKYPQRGPGFGEISAYERSRTRPKTSASADYAPRASTAPARAGEKVPSATTSYQPIDPDRAIDPADFAKETALLFAPGPRAIRGAMSAMRGAREAQVAVPAARQLPGPTPRLTGPSKGELLARDRAARAASRNEEMLRENARRYGLDPDTLRYEDAAQAARLLKKKGGMVSAKPKKMASGGSTSSASKRADGIASRGKTKCKIY